MASTARPGWWVISDTDLLHMLKRVQLGEDAEMVFAEHYANSEHENAEEEG